MRCILDIDGVLADFTGAWCKLYGLQHDPWPGSYNLTEAFGIKDPWEKLTEEFWLNLPLTEWAHELVSLLEKEFTKENICLVTVGPMHEDYRHIGASGKIGWVQKHFPDYVDRLLIGLAREFCANPSTILIDDYEKNIERFKKAGGHGILFPRPWNALASIENIRLDHVNAHIKYFKSWV